MNDKKSVYLHNTMPVCTFSMKKLLLILLFAPFTALFSQVENVVIQWSTDDNQHFFPHALYADGENTLPYLSRKLPWEARNMLPKVEVEVLET